MRIDLTNVAANQIAAEPDPKQVSANSVNGSALSGSEDRTSSSRTLSLSARLSAPP